MRLIGYSTRPCEESIFLTVRKRKGKKKKKEIPRDTRIFSNGGPTQVIGSGTRQLLIGSIFEAMHRDPCLVVAPPTLFHPRSAEKVGPEK